MFATLKNETQFKRKLVADVVSRFGDSLDAIAFSWMVYALTKSAALTATTFAVNILVSVLLSPFSAALITNWNKKNIMVIGDLLRGSLVLMTEFLFYLGYLQPWMIIVTTALNSTIESFRQPAGKAAFPFIVSKEKYTDALSLSSALMPLAELIGMALAGIIIGLIGVTGALLIDALTFLFSAVMIATLVIPKPTIKEKLHPYLAFKKDTKEGFTYVASQKLILSICFAAAMINFTLTPIMALQTAYVAESLQLSALALSVMGIANGIGMVFGGLVVPKLVKIITRYQSLVMSLFGLCFSMIMHNALPLFNGFIWVGLFLTYLILGLSAGIANTIVQVVFMERVEEAFLARATGIMTSLCMVTMPIASFLSAWLVRYLHITNVFLIFGILSLIGSIVIINMKPLKKI